MAMYIVTIWESCDLGDICYEWQSKVLIPECDMEELEGMEVESIQLLD